MTDDYEIADIDLYLLDSWGDLFFRVRRCFADPSINIVRVRDATILAGRTSSRRSIAIVSTSAIGSTAIVPNDCKGSTAMPIIWVDATPGGDSTTTDAHKFSHLLPFDFTSESLRALVKQLVDQSYASATQMAPVTAFIAHSECTRELLSEVDTFADCDKSVLVRGETGVGKESIAQLLHQKHSRYRTGPFIPVNCGAIPDGLFESLFFGHAKGSFTGAIGAHKGYFEQANGGTLFLDEIGDLPLYQQVKLLRVLEDRTVTRVGSTTATKVDFRTVAASNKCLPQLVRDGVFRADLYYRLAVIELHIPSLEERGAADKVALFEAFVASVVGPKLLASLPGIPAWLSTAIAEMPFPGNVRELRNLAERIGVTVQQMGRWDPSRLQRLLAHARREQAVIAESSNSNEPAFGRGKWDMAERNKLLTALAQNAWHRQETAQYLGISRKVLWEKMRKYHIFEEERMQAS